MQNKALSAANDPIPIPIPIPIPKRWDPPELQEQSLNNQENKSWKEKRENKSHLLPRFGNGAGGNLGAAFPNPVGKKGKSEFCWALNSLRTAFL